MAGFTRVEVVELLGDLFVTGGVSRDELVAVAEERKAAPEMLEMLRNLPERIYAHPRQIWEYAPAVPLSH